MTALAPWFLAAAAALAVPIFIHLFQRHQARRFSFPALRYLVRTEREHARQIRLRQLLLLLLRMCVFVFLVGAGARLVWLGRGAFHPPTAVVLVLDNSMSSGAVVGENRVLDDLIALAHRSLDQATPEDRFWVVRAGEPWLPALPGGPLEARRTLDDTRLSAAHGDLGSALRRAAELLETSELEGREIHLISDLQGSAIPSDLAASITGEIPIVTWDPEPVSIENRALVGVTIGGGLAPLQGERIEVGVRMLEAGEDTTRYPIRVVIGDRIRGGGSVAPGGEGLILLPPAGSGWITGYVESDPDPLRADDRRYFAYRSRVAPLVATSGDPGIFLGQALAVLADAGRTREGPVGSSDILVSMEGAGLERRGAATATLVLPPADPALLPALNRRLAEAGIPWRYEGRAASGSVVLSGEALPAPFDRVEARRWFGLSLAGDPPAPTRTLAEADGAPWAVEGTDREGRRYLLLGSPLDAASTTLPVSTGMVRALDWVTGEWAGGASSVIEHLAGEGLPTPAGATHVRFPSGTVQEIDGARALRETGEAGIYTFLAGDTTVSIAAVNPPPRESVLVRASQERLQTAFGPELTFVRSADGWDGAVFRRRLGLEIWWPLLLGVALLLLVESLIAASGRSEDVSSRGRHDSSRPAHVPS